MVQVIRKRLKWSETVKEKQWITYACWIKFLQDRYCGRKYYLAGYDYAYEMALRYVVHMQRATANYISLRGVTKLMPDIWPFEDNGVTGAELCMSMAARANGARRKVESAEISGNSLTLVCQDVTMTYRYNTDLEREYERFLSVYGDRDITEDDSKMEFEAECYDEWTI